MKNITKIKRLPDGLRLIQHRGWSTSNRDPGERCPKCGAGLHYVYDDDDAVFCNREPECNFQYVFTAAELRANRKRVMATLDQEARVEAEAYVRAYGRPVFGETDPHQFELPSEGHRKLLEGFGGSI